MNQLKENMIQTIITLSEQGRSNRSIAKEMGINRKTVNKWVKQYKSEATDMDSKGSKTLIGSEAISISKCKAFDKQIFEKLEQGLSTVRIHEDLTSESGFGGSYSCLNRYIRKLEQSLPEPIKRMECQAGEEAQIDFGEAYVLKNGKKKQKAHILRMTLSYSRKSYSEAVLNQSQENFIRAIENGLRSFGGVPRFLCIDNLKAGVKKADWFDPEVSPKFKSFCDHYNTVAMPTRPYTPEHKGKVEAGVKYVKENGLKGRVFDCLADLNKHLKDWEVNTADKRIHGTTRKQVGEHFEQMERGELGSLVPTLFPMYEEGIRKVQRDGFVQVGQAYYDAPAEYIGHEVWVRWNSNEVSIHRMGSFEKVRTHLPLKRGMFSKNLAMMGQSPDGSTNDYWFNQVWIKLGESCYQWAKIAQKNRDDFNYRILLGLLDLKKKYKIEALQDACRNSLKSGHYNLRALRNELNNPSTQEFMDFSENNGVIREIEEYQSFFEQNTNSAQMG